MNNNIDVKLIDVEGACNVRDIGGYIGLDGKVVKMGRFIRAGGLNGLTKAGIKAVRNLGTDCIIDLRSTREVQTMPDTLAQDQEIRYFHIPMLDYIQSSFASGDLTMFPASMSEMYIGLLEHDQDDFLKIFRLFANESYKTTIFHCTAGKDRTGVTAMLLLGLAGVSKADIIQDYAHSERFIVLPSFDVDIPAYVFESKPETMAAAMDYLEGHYGGIGKYLEHIGVDFEMKQSILQKLYK